MRKPWREIMAAVAALGVDGRPTAKDGKRGFPCESVHRLADIRERYGLNQGVIAGRLGVSQSRVSKIERADVDNAEISTVRAFVAALGGEVEIVASIGKERFTIT